MTMRSKLVSAIEGSRDGWLGNDNRPRPSGWSLPFQGKSADAGIATNSNVAARPQILVEQIVVAGEIGLRRRRQPFCLRRCLDLGLRTPSCHPIELPTGLSAALLGRP